MRIFSAFSWLLTAGAGITVADYSNLYSLQQPQYFCSEAHCFTDWSSVAI